MKERKLTYKSADGLHLTGIICQPPVARMFALMAHGITMHKNEWNNLHFRIARDLAEHAIGSLRFDYRGHGESEGKMRDMTIIGELMDVKGSMKQIQSFWKKPVFIVASSFGAGSAILYAFLNPEKVRSLILLNPVLDYTATFLKPEVDWAKESFTKEAFKNLEQKGYLLLDGAHKLDAKLIEEFKLIRPYEYLNKLTCPVLTIHGNEDSMVPYSVSRKYGRPNKNSKFVTINDAEHGFVRWDDEEGNLPDSIQNQKKVTRLIIDWIKKWS
jgi:pimeloyl-ACP methyl ester carboxylesterase